MSFQWLQMRITEEQDRRRRESEILERLPRALQEVHENLNACVEAYRQSFGVQSAELQLGRSRIQVIVREESEGQWQQRSTVNIVAVPEVPGFRIERGGEPLLIEVGILPSDRVYYRDREIDQYLTMDELTRRILDRVLFPKLRE
jgi:hypothetical protein